MHRNLTLALVLAAVAVWLFGAAMTAKPVDYCPADPDLLVCALVLEIPAP